MTDIAILGARIRTLDPNRPWATAVAGKDGAVVAVGSDDEVRRACPPGAEIIDGQGMVVVPGLTDSHQHPFMGAVETRGVDLAGAATVDQVRERLAGERLRCGDGAWVTGYSLEYSVFEGMTTSGELFERAVGGAPALMTFFDFHTAVATPAALVAAGVDGPRAFEDSSEIVCINGHPTGELREGAVGLVADIVPLPTGEERLQCIADTLAAMNRVGVTAIHMMDGTLATPDECRALEQSGRLHCRQVVPFTVQPTAEDELIEAAIAAGAQQGRLWRSGWAKFFIDGVVETGTAWLEEPDTLGRGMEPNWPDPERYAATVRRFAEAGFPCITHAIGDRGHPLRAGCIRRVAAAGPRPAPGRAHRDRAGRDHRPVRTGGRRGLAAGQSHAVDPARTRRSMVHVPGAGAPRPRLADRRPAPVGGDGRAGLGLAGGRLRPPRGHGLRPPPPRAGPP